MGAGAGLPEIPFPVDQVVTALDPSWNLGDRFVDSRGRIFCLWKIDPALTRDTFATGEVAVLKANHTVTNDVSDAANATYPTFAGIALGSLAESTSTTTVRYGLFLVKGRATVTLTDGNAVLASAFMLQVNTSVDGGCIPVDETATNLADGSKVMFVGHALADDSSTSCDVYVASAIFG